MVLKVYLKILLNCSILCNCVFDNFILAEELFAKILRSFETCVLDNNNLCGKLFSSLESPVPFDESFNVTVFFIPEFKFIKLRIRQITLKQKIKLEYFYSSL